MTETKRPLSRLDKEREARRRLEEARLAFEREFDGWINGAWPEPESRRKTIEAFRAVQDAKIALRIAEVM